MLSGEARRPVRGLVDLLNVLVTGESQKRKAATAMNESSSRAHTLFIMSLDVEGNDRTATSQLFLVDLGGSEQVKRSKVHHGEMTSHGLVLGERMREAVYINLGLLALKNCIDALNNRSAFVPYNNSKLTMLLSPALGGQAKATVIVCGAMEKANAKETLQALRFGETCSRIENSASLQAQCATKLIKHIDEQIADLEVRIAEKERWETVQVIRQDTNVEEGTFEAALNKRRGGEVMNVGRVVGAEQEREELESLIVKRAKLLGLDIDLSLAEAGFGNKFASSAVSSMGGHAQKRFADRSEGLKIKGKVVAEWRT